MKKKNNKNMYWAIGIISIIFASVIAIAVFANLNIKSEPSTLSEISTLVSTIQYNGASLVKTSETTTEVNYKEMGYYDLINPAGISIYELSVDCLQATIANPNFQVYNGFGNLGRPIYYYSYLENDEIVTMYSWCGLSNPNINIQSNKDELVRGYFNAI